MKNIILVGGTMGVGKTTTCQILKQKLCNSVFLDGDWCWDMSPFQVTDETRAMVMENIRFLLNSFLRCSAYENVIFCWVMHHQEIIDDIVSHLDLSSSRLLTLSLTCREESLIQRLRGDIDAGLRVEGDIARTIERLPLYDALNTKKIDVSDMSPEETAEIIAGLVQDMEQYTFSLAEHKDIPEIVRLYKSLVGTPGCTWDDEYPSRESAEADVARNALYILRREGGIIAAASLADFDELGHLPWKPKHPCELARIGVLPTMQKKGIGTILLRHMLAKAKEQGFDGIRMLVSKTNPAALALYHKNGFAQCGETHMFEHDYYCYQIAFASAAESK